MICSICLALLCSAVLKKSSVSKDLIIDGAGKLSSASTEESGIPRPIDERTAESACHHSRNSPFNGFFCLSA